MIKHESSSLPVIKQLTSSSSHAEICAKSQSDLSDKNGRQAGRKNRREAVFAFLGV